MCKVCKITTDFTDYPYRLSTTNLSKSLEKSPQFFSGLYKSLNTNCILLGIHGDNSKSFFEENIQRSKHQGITMIF